MKKVLLGVGAVVGVLVVGVVVSASMQPDVTHLERSTTVAATAADLEPHVVDFQKFVEWSPWQGMDPNQEMTFSDPSSGQGAWYAWKGNDQVGEGRMDLTTVQAGKAVHHLTFIKPFAAEADASILWTEEGDGLKVTWTYDANNDFMAKAMSLVMDMDAMLGPDYERGLASLKTAAEKSAQQRIAEEAKAAEEAAAAEAARAEGEAVEDAAATGG